MNLLLFQSDEIPRPLARTDVRAQHLLQVLRRQPGDKFACGLINGPRGQGTLVAIAADALTLSFVWGEAPPPADPIMLLIGLPRPQTARDILRDATALGVAALHFVATEKSEPSYARSTLWTSGEWRQRLIAGAEQAFCTRVPEVTHSQPLAAVLAALPNGITRLALDNYEAATALTATPVSATVPTALALGPERGWTAGDRAVLRAAGFTLVHLGSRVLRTETAVIAALTLLKSARGSL